MSAAGRMLERRHAGGGWARGVRPLLAALLLVVGAQRASAQTEVVEYYGQDALGSIRIVFDASGAAIARADYEPFGELFTVPTMPGTSELPAKQFTGQERDAEASLDYFGARFFVPRTGRFSQVDPVFAGLFEPQKWNRYQYARNNPLTFVDPTGLDDETPPEDPNAPGGYSCAAILALNAHDPYCWRPSPWDWADPSTYLPGAWNWIGSTLESVMPEITPGDTVVAQLFGVQLIGGAVVAAGVVAAPGVATATTSVALTKAPAATTVVVGAGAGVSQGATSTILNRTPQSLQRAFMKHGLDFGVLPGSPWLTE